jgi:hypothetical protein
LGVGELLQERGGKRYGTAVLLGFTDAEEF